MQESTVAYVGRAEFEHIETPPARSWKCFRRRESRFAFTWHFHREFELTLITEGDGTCYVGDAIAEYVPGSVLLIGPDVPHTYASPAGPPPLHSESMYDAVVAQFRDDFLGTDWLHCPEFADVAALLDRSRRGLLFEPGADVGGFAELDLIPPGEQTVRLLSTLVHLAGLDGRPLASPHYRAFLDDAAHERTQAVLLLLHAQHTQPVRLQQVADVVHLSPEAVSRLFRRTTGMTITGYLNLLRVNASCRQLVETRRRIADIAADSGFANLSHFNRQFRALKGMSPSEYRAEFNPGPASNSRDAMPA